MLSRLLIISKNVEEINYFSQILIKHFDKFTFYNDYQEIFCIGILVDSLLISTINHIDNFFDLDSLSNLMNSLEINLSTKSSQNHCNGILHIYK